jgi:hypothetical protein
MERSLLTLILTFSLREKEFAAGTQLETGAELGWREGWGSRASGTVAFPSWSLGTRDAEMRYVFSAEGAAFMSAWGIAPGF